MVTRALDRGLLTLTRPNTEIFGPLSLVAPSKWVTVDYQASSHLSNAVGTTPCEEDMLRLGDQDENNSDGIVYVHFCIYLLISCNLLLTDALSGGHCKRWAGLPCCCVTQILGTPFSERVAEPPSTLECLQ